MVRTVPIDQDSVVRGELGERPERREREARLPSDLRERIPETGLKEYWHRLMSLVRRRTLPPPQVRNEEWNGFHLPSTIRVDYRTYVFSRVTVPIDADRSRIVYFHAVRSRTWLGRVSQWLRFHLWQNWQQNRNFSGQDRSIVVRQSYDRPEKLSGTDVFPLETRRLILEHARGLDRSAGADPPVTIEEDRSGLE